MKLAKLTSAVAASLAVAAVPSMLQAGTVPSEGESPDLTPGEKLLVVVTEQHASLLAAYVEARSETGDDGCVGDFEWEVHTFTAAGTATSTVDDHTVRASRVNEANDLDGTWITTTDEPGEIDDTPVGAECTAPLQAAMEGNHYLSDDGEIYYASADFCIGAADPPFGVPFAGEYDEHVVKDIFVHPEFPRNRRGQLVVHDKGIEVITKKRPLRVDGQRVLVGWPRAKWLQFSRYVKPNGFTGSYHVRKVRVAPDGAPSCYMSIWAEIDGDGAGFDSEDGGVELTSLRPARI